MTRKTLTINYGKEGAKVIREIPLITVEPVKLNERLWELHNKCARGVISIEEMQELDALCLELENQA